jgi:hypothetical protein
MTISSTTRIAGPYTGSGTTGPFTFAFKVFQASDLVVVKREISTATDTTLTLTTDYSVTLNGNQNSSPGGSVTLVSSISSAYELTLTSSISNLQPTDLTNQGGFYPEVITDALDRACIQIQQLASLNTRSLVAPISDGLGTSLALPAADLRANKYLAFDANGVPMAADGTDTPNITSAGDMTITANNAGSNVARDVIFYDNATETMRINRTTTPGSTRVGVGTATPAGTLGVVSDAVIGNQASTGTSGTIRLISSAGFNYLQSGQAAVGGSAATLLVTPYGAGSEYMRAQSAGVGIGNLGSSPVSRLHVHEAASVTATDIRLTSAVTGATASDGVSLRLDTSGNSSLWNYENTALLFATNNGERMRIDSAGLVGIGTNSPGSTLDVQGGQIRVRSTGAYSQPGVGCGALYYDATNGNFTIDARSPSGNTALLFRTSSSGTGADRMQITAAGEVWIAGSTDQGAYNLQCNGTGVWGAGAYVNGSDSRIKHDINPIGPCLDLVSTIQPVTFIYNSNWSSDQTVQTGFIAQQLQTALAGQEYLNGIVSQGGEYLNVAYQNIIPLLTKSIQELKAIVDAQAARIATLEANA